MVSFITIIHVLGLGLTLSAMLFALSRGDWGEATGWFCAFGWCVTATFWRDIANRRG